MVEYRCGCCQSMMRAGNPIAWCCAHDIYECRSCWEHGHPWATEDTWGNCDEEPGDDCHKGLTDASQEESGSDTERS